MRNQLTVDTGKTEAMILKANGFIGPLRPIMFGNAMIKYVTNSTCLGSVIDNRLTWTKHHEKVMKSFSAKVKELKRFIYLPRTVQEQIYYKTVITAITYCIAVWGTASDSHMDEPDTLHAKAAKIIYNIKENCSDEEVLQKANWESISYLYKRRLLTWMHQIYYETCPLPITEHFTKKSGRLTNPLQFIVPRYRRDIERTSLKYRGAVLWTHCRYKL